ncbi:MAG TPA: GNAT family protein [Longimicrobium sp.]|nr:GNAT family protein [Longimicrobium sp.]
MIKGNLILLRPVRSTDLDALYGFLTDLSTRGEHFPLGFPSESAFRKDFQETGFWTEAFGRLLICEHDGPVRGSIWYFKPAPYMDALEIGYQMFDVHSRRRGYMSEALGLLVRYLFATRQLSRVQLTTLTANTASQRVAEKNGFQREGVLRGAVYLRGESHDVQMFSLLRHELPAAGASAGPA